MIIFDSTYLIAFLHPNPPPPKDENEKPVEKFKERIAYLVETLNAADTLVGVPTPVVAEILVRYPQNKQEYIEILRNRYKFEIVPFGVKAAIEAAELIATLAKENPSQPRETWAKVKFDIQITATAAAEEVTMLYADDKKIVNYAKRRGIPVKRIWELQIPPEKKPEPPPAEDATGQKQLFERTEEPGGEAKKETQPAPAQVSGSTERAAESKTAGQEQKAEQPEKEAQKVATVPEKPKPAVEGGPDKGSS